MDVWLGVRACRRTFDYRSQSEAISAEIDQRRRAAARGESGSASSSSSPPGIPLNETDELTAARS